MEKSKLRFTSVEALILSMVLLVTAAVVAPRIISRAQAAREQICDRNIELIEEKLDRWKDLHGSGPRQLNELLSDREMFPGGPPECPLGGEYKMTEGLNVYCDPR